MGGEIKVVLMFVMVRKHVLLILVLVGCLAFGSVARAEDCEEARKWYLEGLSLSDNSEREVSYYKKAIELCPNYFEARNKLGEVYKSWGEFERAVKEFELAGRSPTFAKPHFNLGEIYRMQGRYDLAAEAFTQALKMDPRYREAQNQLQYAEKRLGVYDAAKEEPPELIPISIFARIPGMSIPKGSFITDVQYKYWRQEGDFVFVEGEEAPLLGAPAKRKVGVHALILGLRYGLTNSFTIGVIPTFFSRTADVKGSGIDAEPNATGVGDTTVLTKYRLWSRRRNYLSAFFLLGIPTGDEDATGEDQGIIRSIPLGSGSYSYSPGLAFTSVIDPVTVNVDVWGIIADDTIARQAGDEFRADLALACPNHTGKVVGILELNYRWQDSATRRVLFQTQILRPPLIGPPWDRSPGGPVLREATLIEEGGHTLFVSPGFQAFFRDTFKFELGAQIPLLRPEGTVENFIFHFGLMKYWW